MKISAPHNNTWENLDCISKNFRDKIDELYFSPPPDIIGSARTMENNHRRGEFAEIIRFCHDCGIKTDLLLNSSCTGLKGYMKPYIDRLTAFLSEVNNAGVDCVTVANPLLLNHVKKEFPAMRTVVSILAEVDSAQRATFYQNLGADCIVIDRDINRDLQRIREIRRAVKGCEIRILVNEGCIYRCPCRNFHYNFLSHQSADVRMAGGAPSLGIPAREYVFDFQAFCGKVFRESHAQALKSPWVRPEDVKKYEGLADSIKIAGRKMSACQIYNAINAYSSGEYSGNLTSLFANTCSNQCGWYLDNSLLNGFFEKVTACGKDCASCGYCDDFASRLQV